MSTLKFSNHHLFSTKPEWTREVPEHLYHDGAARGYYLTSSMLKEFRECPTRYRDIVAGKTRVAEKNAFRIGRAVHKIILEGDAAYRRSYHVGGPINDRTGRGYGVASRAFHRWVAESGLDPRTVLTRSENRLVTHIRDAVFRHREAARLFAEGWPELVAEAELAGMPCRARSDWLRPDGVIVDLKTVADLGRFEQNARKFGYLHQFAFYRAVSEAAGADNLTVQAVVVEKCPPHRVGVWTFPASVLDSYQLLNTRSINDLRSCLEKNTWPTGYEQARSFPPVGMHPFMLN
ncbi:MAG: PD-(D/E)XK nuclease-like domain-containing protein [Planctomycetes bacterium]|nr:PD-(D/E)XK nuclease-like domain-containing protein [Planctomycetota bacterium]